eukprot:scaffold158_cov388-Prasinococcus_capsulatus_cf.AAC.17
MGFPPCRTGHCQVNGMIMGYRSDNPTHEVYIDTHIVPTRSVGMTRALPPCFACFACRVQRSCKTLARCSATAQASLRILSW